MPGMCTGGGYDSHGKSVQVREPEERRPQTEGGWGQVMEGGRARRGSGLLAEANAHTEGSQAAFCSRVNTQSPSKLHLPQKGTQGVFANWS